MKTYIFQGIIDNGPKLLEEADYMFKVRSHAEPYEKENGNMVFPVTLIIAPSGKAIIARPWSGETRSGEMRDGIGEFLLAINRAPAIGKVPDWDSVDGATGHCRLRIREAEGNFPARNEVAYFFRPKVLPKNELPNTGPLQEEAEPDGIPF